MVDGEVNLSVEIPRRYSRRSRCCWSPRRARTAAPRYSPSRLSGDRCTGLCVVRSTRGTSQDTAKCRGAPRPFVTDRQAVSPPRDPYRAMRRRDSVLDRDSTSAGLGLNCRSTGSTRITTGTTRTATTAGCARAGRTLTASRFGADGVSPRVIVTRLSQ